MQPILGVPRDSLSESAVREALDAVRRIRHGVTVLDTADAPTGEVLPVEKGGSVAYSYRPPDPITGQTTEVAEVRRRASLILAGPTTVNLHARRLLLWTEWQMADSRWARFHQGVFVATNPPVEDDGTVVRRRLTLADKSYRWKTTELTDPITVAAGAVVVDWIKASLTAKFGETKFAIATSAATLGQERVFEPGMSYLEMYSLLLEAIGFDQLTADENGRPASQSLAVLATKGPEKSYGAGLGRIVVAGQVEPLMPTLPNVLRFSARQGPSLGNVEGNGLYTVVNQSDGPASIDARAGEQVEQRVDVEADGQATLVAIAEADKQRYFAGGGLRFTGHVGLNPLHSDRDVVEIVKPRLDIAGGAWIVTAWEYPRGPMDDSTAVMPITCERRVA